MSKNPETLLTDKMRDYLDSLWPDLWYFKVHGHGMQKPGVPDLVICYKGIFIAPEVKVPGNGPSRIQTHVMGEIDAARGITGCVYSVEELKGMIARGEDMALRLHG